MINWVASLDARNDAATVSPGSMTLALAARAASLHENHLIWVTWETANTTVSATDTAGNVYTAPPELLFKSPSNAQWVQGLYVLDGLAHATNVVTVTWGAAGADFRGIDYVAFAGTTGVVTYDNGGSGDQPAGTTLTMTLTPTGAGSNFLSTGIKSFNSNVFQNGYAPGWASISSVLGPTEYHHAEYQIVNGASPVAGGTVALSTNLTGAYAIFKESVNDGTYPLTSDLYF